MKYGRVVIIDNGLGNISSLRNSLKKIGINSDVSDNQKIINDADFVILPGVATFGATIDALHNRKIYDSIINRHLKNKFLLGICSGMHVLFEESDESPDHQGLGIICGNVRKIQAGYNISWARLNYENKCCQKNKILDDEYYYFNHGFRCEVDPTNVCAYDQPTQSIPAIVRKDNTFGVQFHPEKSQQSGLEFLASLFKGSIRCA